MSISIEEAKNLTQSYNNENARPVPPTPPPRRRPVPELESKSNSIIKDDIEENYTISKIRLSNPNLQPLSSNEIQHLKKNGRHSIQALPTIPSSKSSEFLTRHHSFGSNENKSIFRSRSLLRSGTKQKLESSSNSQDFWKYHILEFGNGLYLTCNPDSKHIYCRNAPGFYIEIQYPTLQSGRKDSTGKNGFRMVFKNQVDGDVFSTVTMEGDKFEINLLSRYYLTEDGTLEIKEGDVQSYHHKTKNIDLKELQGKYIESQSKLVRYELEDINKDKWYLGSIPQFKSATKLKNKRYIYFHEPKGKILACFRPQEVRAKKKLIKKFNRSLQSGSNGFYYDENNSDDTSGSSETIYYSPGDGVFQQDPPDDSPNDVKLGWITIYDDFNKLKIPGMWEITLGFTLAAGFSQILEENRNVKRFST
ncbi:hypothetical protein BN7_183 [Wickerhamomyces ciferrii]|uniref:Uncharacterized protein n=1 Tax=Wickerhamomyces ciferrii (strain ATCC 14091 / BCRC 22168 / CBS 111 / JCM 3599 / NBRC 0793 / NRRL Y-1031 F-60-10) TaxID=1206466 RepID=K0KGX8_WICCF|nr:uncharacterized protein BN7_183 [Wickerhamomyces ciferrii]CCH40649.1 hypothetical protein BN7_183 [Wickerhamomyces ciferrii]